GGRRLVKRPVSSWRDGKGFTPTRVRPAQNPSRREKRSTGKERLVPEREPQTAPDREERLRRTRPELIAQARSIGLRGAHRLSKAALAAQIQQAGHQRAVSEEEPAPQNTHHKFDLGLPPGEPREQASDIPWG